MTRYRLIYGPKRIPKGPWRSSREGAELDALDRGLATRDEFDEDVLYFDPMTEIEEDSGA